MSHLPVLHQLRGTGIPRRIPCVCRTAQSFVRETSLTTPLSHMDNPYNPSSNNKPSSTRLRWVFVPLGSAPGPRRSPPEPWGPRPSACTTPRLVRVFRGSETHQEPPNGRARFFFLRLGTPFFWREAKRKVRRKKKVGRQPSLTHTKMVPKRQFQAPPIAQLVKQHLEATTKKKANPKK